MKEEVRARKYSRIMGKAEKPQAVADKRTGIAQSFTDRANSFKAKRDELIARKTAKGKTVSANFKGGLVKKYEKNTAKAGRWTARAAKPQARADKIRARASKFAPSLSVQPQS